MERAGLCHGSPGKIDPCFPCSIELLGRSAPIGASRTTNENGHVETNLPGLICLI